MRNVICARRVGLTFTLENVSPIKMRLGSDIFKVVSLNKKLSRLMRWVVLGLVKTYRVLASRLILSINPLFSSVTGTAL